MVTTAVEAASCSDRGRLDHSEAASCFDPGRLDHFEAAGWSNPGGVDHFEAAGWSDPGPARPLRSSWLLRFNARDPCEGSWLLPKGGDHRLGAATASPERQVQRCTTASGFHVANRQHIIVADGPNVVGLQRDQGLCPTRNLEPVRLIHVDDRAKVSAAQAVFRQVVIQNDGLEYFEHLVHAGMAVAK
jgi:hypothetical protein